jgi:hypothetical protein
MSALGTLALSAGEVAFFTRPPRRDQGPSRRREGLRRIGRVIRLIRRELAHATRHSRIDATPRLPNYPY